MAAEERSMPFIRNLASSDRKTRTAALSSLRAFLSAHQQQPNPASRTSSPSAPSLTPLDQLKLWKGLFFALWMCDRAVPQQALCADLASLPPSAGWLRAFWATMAREWGEIDAYRMDKFMLLVRRVLAASFAWMRTEGPQRETGRDGQGGGDGRTQREGGGGEGRGWDTDRVDVVLTLLREWPFALETEVAVFSEPGTGTGTEGGRKAKGSRELSLAPVIVPAGLRLHVLDIWVDEAERAGLLDDDDDEARAIVLRIVSMVDALERETKSPAVRIRSKDSLADERLPGSRRRGTADAEMPDVGDDESWDGFED